MPFDASSFPTPFTPAFGLGDTKFEWASGNQANPPRLRNRFRLSGAYCGSRWIEKDFPRNLRAHVEELERPGMRLLRCAV